MKKFIVLTVSAVMAITMCFALSGCGTKLPYSEYKLGDYLKVGNYKGLEVEDFTVKVTKDDVDSYIESNLESASETKDVKKSDTIEEGDTLNIDYEGKINGKTFEGGSNKGDELTIGSGKFIDGFEDGLIGKKIGDEVELDLTFPDEYHSKDLQGKDVVFTVKINSATREVVPEYNLDFVKKNTKYKSLDAYEKSVEKTLYETKETEAINNQKTTLWSEVLENTEVKEYPQEEVDYYIEFNSNQIDEMAKTYGMTRKEFLKSYEFGGEKDFKAVNEDSSKLRVKQEMLIMYIAEKEDLKYTDDEKEALIADFEKQGYDEEAIKKQTGRSLDGYAHIELLYGKVLDFLLDNAKIVDAATAKDTAK